ncbi:hypothetical protein DPMN_107447 [Dreissena polymorpha]|uniref:Uncharacterized protein n=1 Tax=Dreissena polymorpha TaxID=45954 RepID=A0A9D4K6S4_DREPO|nr:hypothetical protein DPMN_107447 [Dreissena polymorpha]
MKAHRVAASATLCLQKVRRTLLVKLAIICFLLMALYGIAFKYIDMTITHKFQPLNMHGYDTEHGKVERYKVLTTGESSERVAVLMNVTRNGNAFTNKSMSGLQYVNRSIAVHDSIPNSFNAVIVETNNADQNESNTYVNNLTVQSEITLNIFNKTFDVADSLANRFNTGIVKNSQSPQNETQTDANVIPTDQSVPKAERLVRMPMADISQTGNKLTDMVNTTQAPQNDKQTDAIPQVIPDRSVPKAERLVSMRMTDISQLASKLPGVLTYLQPLGPGIKESPEFPGMPDPCAGPKRMTGVEDILCMVRLTVYFFFV